jgi:hypothetical protein
MQVPILIILMILMVMFFIVPQLSKLRTTLGIQKILDSGAALGFWNRAGLYALGLKTPVLNTLAFVWTFVLTEGDSLRSFGWEQIMSHDHAVWVATGLWAAGVWSHFSGMQTAAASMPVLPQLPDSIQAAEQPSSVLKQ